MTMYAVVQGKGDESILAENEVLDRFLATVEKRAFLMARTALGNDEDALDTVQDAMMMLVKNYRHKSEDDWRLLFFRMLSNRIRDLIRRRVVRNRYGGWLGGIGKDADEDIDPFQQVPDPYPTDPSKGLERHQSMVNLDQALKKLPARQLEAFMLRCWEGLSTAETASAMKCSQGSVKTHYSRALKSLQVELEEHRDE